MSERPPRQGNPPHEGGFAQEEYPYGYPAQGYNLPFDQPPRMNENMPRKRKVKRIGQTGVVNMGTNAGVECNYEDMNQQHHNHFPPADWGVNEPIIEGCGEIAGKGKMNMGINSGVIISTGKRAKEIVAPKEDRSNVK